MIYCNPRTPFKAIRWKKSRRVTYMIVIPNRTFLVRFGGINYEDSATQASLVEPWVVFWRDQTSLVCCRSVPYKGAVRYLPYPNSS